jgi:hypothetical protein
MVVFDGKEGRRYPEAFYPIFSPDGKSLAYWARTADRKTNYVIWDEKEVAQMAGEPALVFAPDGRSLACSLYKGELYRIGQRVERLAAGYDRASPPVVSPDGKHIACTFGKEMKWRVCVDGKSLSGRYDPEVVKNWDGPSGGGSEMILDSPGFSADGQHVFVNGFRGPPANRSPFANPARVKGQHFIVCDGIEGSPHEELWIPEDFKNHAKRLRYVVRDGDRLRLMEWAWLKDRTWQNAVE